jgi:hypothetical protein
MNGCLQINSQKWNLWGSEGMKLLLPRQHKEGCIYFQTDWSFVPSDVEPATVPAEVPKLRLRLIGLAPGLREWRDLENLFIGYSEPVDDSEPSDLRGPDMWIFKPGATTDPEYSKWETNLKFGERRGYEFDFTLEALKRSERASKYRVDNAMKQFFQQPLPPDWEVPEWINEGDELSFAGRIELKEIFCSIPINSAQPIEWAKRLTKRELAMEQFGPCTLSDLTDLY